MKFCIVNQENQIITNMIVCETAKLAAQFGAVPSYDGARIGAPYSPPTDPTPEDILNTLLGVI